MGEERAGEADELVPTSMVEARLMMVIYWFEWPPGHKICGGTEDAHVVRRRQDKGGGPAVLGGACGVVSGCEIL